MRDILEIKHAFLRSINKYWFVQNQNNVSIGATCLPAHLFQRDSAIKIQLSMLVLFKADIIISSNVICSRYDIAE